jgi:hypothetical protein
MYSSSIASSRIAATVSVSFFSDASPSGRRRRPCRSRSTPPAAIAARSSSASRSFTSLKQLRRRERRSLVGPLAHAVVCDQLDDVAGGIVHVARLRIPGREVEARLLAVTVRQQAGAFIEPGMRDGKAIAGNEDGEVVKGAATVGHERQPGAAHLDGERRSRADASGQSELPSVEPPQLVERRRWRRQLDLFEPHGQPRRGLEHGGPPVDVRRPASCPLGAARSAPRL